MTRLAIPTDHRAHPDRVRASGHLDRPARRRAGRGSLKLLGQELASITRSRTDAEILSEIAGLRTEQEQLLATPVVQELISADEAIDYLSSLGRLWRETDDYGRRMLAVATFSRIAVRAITQRSSHRIVSFDLTPDAERHGLHLALRTQGTEDAAGRGCAEPPALRVVEAGR